MKKIALRFLQCILICILALCFVQPVSAHGDEPRLEISAERINPGGVIDIRGVEFDYEEAVTLYLERPGIRIQAGEVIVDVQGIFLHTMVLPADLPEGTYNFRAVTDHHEVRSPVLVVQGSAVMSEAGGQGARDEDDNLLAPMPTYAPGVVPGGVSQPTDVKTSPEAPLETGASPNWIIPLFISSIFLSIGMIVWMRRRFLRRS